MLLWEGKALREKKPMGNRPNKSIFSPWGKSKVYEILYCPDIQIYVLFVIICQNSAIRKLLGHVCFPRSGCARHAIPGLRLPGAKASLRAGSASLQSNFFFFATPTGEREQVPPIARGPRGGHLPARLPIRRTSGNSGSRPRPDLPEAILPARFFHRQPQ